MLMHGIRAWLPLLPSQDTLRLTLLPCSFVVRPQGAIHRLQFLDVSLHVRQGRLYDIQAAVDAAGQTRQQGLGRLPFFAPRLCSSESRTSWRAALIRTPGGCSGPPWLSLRMPRTAAQYPSTTSPASSSTSGASAVATPVASRALSVRTTPPALDAPGSGVAALAGVADAGAAALGVAALLGDAGGGGDCGATACRRSSNPRRSMP